MSSHMISPLGWSLVWEDSPEEGNTPVFLPGESHGQRSLAGYHPWGLEETPMSMTG